MTKPARLTLLVCATLFPACRSSPLTESTSAACQSAHDATFLASVPGNVDALLSDGTNLYWLDKFAGTISVAPTAGGAVTTLATFPQLWSGPCGQPGFSVDCLQASLAADDDNLYAAGPLGVYRVPKAGGTPSAIATYGGESAYAFGPLVVAGGSLFWQEGDIVSLGDEGLTLEVRIVQQPQAASPSVAPQPFASAGADIPSTALLASDGTRLYWLDGGLRAAPLAGGAATTVYTSDTLFVENMTLAGARLVWTNQQMEGGPIGDAPLPAQSPHELVQSVATSGGAATSLITFPSDTDPGVTVLGDARYAYAVVVDYYAGTSEILAAKLDDGATKTIVKDANLASATLDACNLYYVTEGQSAQMIMKIGKPN